MDLEKSQKLLSQLSAEELAKTLGLLGHWWPQVAGKVVDIKASFVEHKDSPSVLKKVLEEALTIDNFVDHTECDSYFLIVVEAHEQLNKLARDGKTDLAKELAHFSVKISDESLEHLDDGFSWEDETNQLREWAESL